jgi:hypothetical protein
MVFTFALTGICLALAAGVSQPAVADVNVPAGTRLVIRTQTAIDSDKADLGQEYGAGLADPLIIDGRTIAPRGAAAVLRIEQTASAGTMSGRASLTLKLTALQINGKRVAVETGEATVESGSQGKAVGKGGALGGVLGGAAGAMLGGAGGAVKGAAAGAAAGATIVAIKGQRVHVAAETRLVFTLSRELAIQ